MRVDRQAVGVGPGQFDPIPGLPVAPGQFERAGMAGRQVRAPELALRLAAAPGDRQLVEIRVTEAVFDRHLQ